MKKSVFEMVVALVNGREVADMNALRTAVNDEWEIMQARSHFNMATYDAAFEIANTIINDKPMTAKEIFTAGVGQWPEGFTTNKLIYALRDLWGDNFTKHRNGKAPNTYSI